MKEHAVIIVPGLGDEVLPVNLAVRGWERAYGLTPIIYPMHWKLLDENFEKKLQRLQKKFKDISKKYDIISLIGYSAGGSGVVNLFLHNSERVHKVVSVCGRLERGRGVFPTLEEASKVSPAFAQSVIRAEKGIKKLTKKKKQKIMTITSRFGDNIVPISTALIPEVVNCTVPIYGHIPSIAYAFLFPKKMIDFIKNE